MMRGFNLLLALAPAQDPTVLLAVAIGATGLQGSVSSQQDFALKVSRVASVASHRLVGLAQREARVNLVVEGQVGKAFRHAMALAAIRATRLLEEVVEPAGEASDVLHVGVQDLGRFAQIPGDALEEANES